jgi:catechol-2,3-dioxygenase
VAISRLNHAVLHVGDLERSVAFYRDVLDFTVLHEFDGRAVFLRAAGSANDHDLALFGDAALGAPTAGRSTVGLYHLAWELETLTDLGVYHDRLREAGLLGGYSDHGVAKSLYAHDPDGIEFEMTWLVPAHLLDDEARSVVGARPLDLEREKARYGADTRGGLGVSVPLDATAPPPSAHS